MAVGTSIYEVEVRDFYGRIVTVINNPLAKEWGIYLNKPGYCQFTMDAYDPQATTSNFIINQYDIVFKRYGTPVFAGQLYYLYPNVDDNDKYQIDVIANGHYDILQQRMVNPDFSNYDSTNLQVSVSGVDSGQVIWDLITATQFPLSNDGNIFMQGTSPTLNQSFVASGTAAVQQLKLLLQNVSYYSGTITNISATQLTDSTQSWPSLTGAMVMITNGTDANDIQWVGSNTGTVITLYGADTVYTGTSTGSNTTTTVNDTGQSWTTNALVGSAVSITGGTDSGDSNTVISNTSTSITISSAWAVTPDNTSTYSITVEITNGLTSSATTSSLTDTTKSWLTNIFAGQTITIAAGTDNGDAQLILSNTSDTIVISGNWNAVPDTTSVYQITPSLTGNFAVTPNIGDGYAIYPPASLATGNLIVGIYADSHGVPSNTLIANSQVTTALSTIPLSPTPGTNIFSWFEMAYTGTQPQLVQGTTYWIKAYLDTNQTGNNGVQWAYLNGNYYSSGKAYSPENPNLFQNITGTATSASANTITDSAQSWTPDQLAGGTITITGGTDINDIKQITSNTASTIVINGTWQTTPDTSSTYSVNLNQDLQFFIWQTDNSFQMTKNTYLGIEQGNIQTSFNITRTFPAYKIIKEAIDEISQLDSGIDFAITWLIDANNVLHKYFNVYYPFQGQNNTGLSFIYPGNILKINKSKDGTQMANAVYVRGQGSGINQPITTSVSQESIQQYGVREMTTDFSDIPDVQTLQSLGDAVINTQADPLELPDFTLDGNSQPQIGEYGLGDTIQIVSNGPGLLNYTTQFRVEEILVKIDDSSQEFIEISVSDSGGD